MYTVKYISETDIQEVKKGKLKINGSWFTIWKDSICDLFINLKEREDASSADIACIDDLTAKAHKLVALYYTS